MDKDYCPVTHWSKALFPFDAKEKIMAFITGYFDESYNPLVYTVAGYVSTDDKWAEFQKEWQAVLDRENLPHFSMKDFGSPKIYVGWTEERKISFLKELHSIINKAQLNAFSANVIIDHYNVLPDEIKFTLGRPHVLATTSCLTLIKNWTEEKELKEPIAYVFEKGTKDDKRLRQVMNSILDNEEKYGLHIEKVAFDTKALLPLQAADVLAYETRKDISRRLEKGNIRKMRKSFESLIDWSRFDYFILDNEYFQIYMSMPKIRNLPINSKEFQRNFALAKKKGYLK